MIRIYNAFKSKDHLINSLTTALATCIDDYSARPALLLLSGGSSLDLLPELENKLKEKDKALDNLYITMLDERFDKVHSNYLSFQQTSFFSYSQSLGATVFGIDNYEDPPIETASRFSNQIDEILHKKPQIIAIMGMGADGHMSGIMPYPENRQFFQKTFIETKQPYIYYDASRKNEFPLRITSTIPFIEKIDTVFSYITGRDKLYKLQEALKKEQDLYKVPYSVINKLKDVRVYTDLPIRNA